MCNGTAASATRAIFMGGEVGSSINVIQYITIGSTGNATDFGDLIAVIQWSGTTSNATKAISGAGYNDNGTYPVAVDVVTIASTGNATDFGDLTEAGRNLTAACGGQGGLTA